MKFQNRVIIENLSLKCNWQQLRDHFGSCSGIVYVTAHKIPRTGTIQFESRDSLYKAVRQYDRSKLFGRSIIMVVENLQTGTRDTNTISSLNKNEKLRNQMSSRDVRSSGITNNKRVSFKGKRNFTLDGIEWRTNKQKHRITAPSLNSDNGKNEQAKKTMNLHSLDENVTVISTSNDSIIEDKNENLSSVTIESISESEDENTSEIESNIEKSKTIPKDQFEDLEKFDELPLEESSKVVPKENCDDLEKFRELPLKESSTVQKENFDDFENFEELPLEEPSTILKEQFDDSENEGVPSTKKENRSPKINSSNSNDLNTEELEGDIEKTDHNSLPSSYHNTTTRIFIMDDDDEIIGYTSSKSSETIVGKDN